ncbi:8294_t:CDS:2 [Funneliformis mosseae]|uniref:8294_t:CDS:1 n=1 Tax=Funneliformis mosseae TaxID=27381 RepID=A0A9N9AHQ7_FUNMO|nr:8294_t:CDS:2 [Funneliformis mosseae]
MWDSLIVTAYFQSRYAIARETPQRGNITTLTIFHVFETRRTTIPQSKPLPSDLM